MEVILGTGPLGMAIMKELVKKDKRVRMVNTSGKGNVPAGVEVIRANLMNEEEARAVIEGAKTVFQCSQPPYHKWEGLFPQLMKNITGAAAKHQVNLVMGDNLYMYGEVKGLIHEELPYQRASKKGRVRAELAEQLLDLHRSGKVRVVIGRGSDFFGPLVRNSYVGDRFFAPIVSGKGCALLGNPDLPHTFTYIEDFARALVMLSEHEDTYGEAWHVPNEETVTARRFAEMCYEAAGYPPKIKRMSSGMLRIGGLFIPAAREVIEMMYQFEQPFQVDSSKFAKRFGEQASPTPLKTAIARTVEWYRQNLIRYGYNR